MTAALKQQPQKKKKPATARQIAKLIQLIVDQNPSSQDIQAVFDLLPRLMKAEKLKSINRFDLFTMIGSPMPFKASLEGIVPDGKYKAFSSDDLIAKLAGAGVKIGCTLDSKSSRKTYNLSLDKRRYKHPEKTEFLIITNTQESSSYDLRSASGRELLEWACDITENTPDYLLPDSETYVYVKEGLCVRIAERKVTSFEFGPPEQVEWYCPEATRSFVTRTSPVEILETRHADWRQEDEEQDE